MIAAPLAACQIVTSQPTNPLAETTAATAPLPATDTPRAEQNGETLPPAVSPAVTDTPTPDAPATDTPTLTASATATVEPTAQLSGDLLKIVESDDWASLGMEPAQAAAWEEFARTGAGISGEDERKFIQNFVNQWEAYHQAASGKVLPDGAEIGYRVSILDHETGGPEPVLYAIVAGSEAQPTGEQLFLVASNRKHEPVGLLAAPIMDRMSQRIRSDGKYVEYVDTERNIVLLYADARYLTSGRKTEEVLLDIFKELYKLNHPYVRYSLFPRYFFPMEGVEASFYTLDTLLSYPQIVQMNEAFDLLNRPEFAALKDAIFTTDTSVAIVEGSDYFLGRTFLGTGVMQLNRRDLLGNKYFLVSVLAHEGAHVLQTNPTGPDSCKLALKHEVGDQATPPDFFKWTADQVVEAVRSQKIGAYHAGFWVLGKLGVLETYIPSWRTIIRTGKINDTWVAAACEQ